MTIPTRTASNVCIVGFADGHRHLALNLIGREEPDTEFWGINRLHAVLPGRTWHRWFEIHDLKKFYRDDEEHRGFLAGALAPVYIRPQDAPLAKAWGIKAATPYPLDDVLEAFPRYFTNTISYLLALAILMEFEKISMFGVDMAQDTVLHAEYAEQRPSCEYFLGVAQGLGIEVELPPGSDLLKSFTLYGFDDDTIARGKLLSRREELNQRLANVQGQVAQLDGQRGQMIGGINQLQGALQQVDYELRNLMPSEAIVGPAPRVPTPPPDQAELPLSDTPEEDPSS